MKKFILGMGCLAGLLALGGMGFGQTVLEHVVKGDERYAQLDDRQALEEYLAAIELDGSNYEALWKAARAYVDVADLIDGTGKDAKEERKQMYGNAQRTARKAVSVNPDDTWGHFYLSAAMGKKVLLQGKKEQIDASKKIKAEIERALELDGTNDLAFHAMGRWHRRMAEIGGAKRFFGGLIYGSIPKGSFEESEKFLKKAVELKPEYVNHHLELGRTYVAMDQFDLAAGEFQKALDLPVSASKDKLLKEEAKEELAKLQKKKS